jgi:DNA repair protein RadC
MMNTDISPIAELGAKWNIMPPKPRARKKIYSSSDIFDFVYPAWPDVDLYESFWIVLLSRSNAIMGISKIGTGGISATYVDPKIVFQRALLSNCSYIVLVHNHPSGNEIPSDEDNKLTEKLSSVGRFLELPVLDHLILSPDGTYFSYADNGKL